MKISFSNPAAVSSGIVVVGVNEGNKLSSSAAGIDKASGGSLIRAIKASTFKGKKGQQWLTIRALHVRGVAGQQIPKKKKYVPRATNHPPN